MKILIAGGAGFIGSHLCDAYLEKGCQVICMDNLITGSEKNISHLLSNSSFSFIKADISKEIVLEDKIDFVMNFASPASPVDYLNNPIETLKAGSLGVFNTLELAKSNNAGYFLASTSEVYGDPLISPQVESYWGNVNTIGPRSVYDEAKRFAEAASTANRRKYDMEVKIVRIFNTYGPRMKTNDGRVVPNFIDQALKGKKLTIYGSGTQTRSFCYISDLIDGIVKMADSIHPGPVNLGNPNEFTVLSLAKKVNSLFSLPEKNITYEDLPQDDPKQRKPDISLAKLCLGWVPVVELDEGLRRTIAYFKAQK